MESFLGGQSDCVSFWRNIVLRRKPWCLAGEAGEAGLRLCWGSWDAMWAKGARVLPGQLRTGEDHSLVSCIRFPAWGTRSPCHGMCLRRRVPQQLGRMMARVKCASSARTGLPGAPRAELWWAGCPWLLEGRGHRLPRAEEGSLLCLLFPVFH